MKTVSVLCVTLLYVIGQVSAKVPVVCHKTTYTQWKSNLHHRYDEVSKYDCPSSNCGGQCVALVKCNCGAPYTGLWSQGISVSAFCKSGSGHIKPGTAIATFQWGGEYNNRWTDHTAVFLGCTGHHGHFQVMEQACGFSTRRAEYSSTSSLYYKFHVIMTDHGNLNPPHHCHSRHTGC